MLRHVRGRRYDAVFATSSRLMTAALGATVARLKGVPLYLDIRDIFVDTMQDLMPGATRHLVRGVFGALESWTMRRAARINLVSPGFRGYFERRYPGRSFSSSPTGSTTSSSARSCQDPPPRADRPRSSMRATSARGDACTAILPGLAAALAGAHASWSSVTAAVSPPCRARLPPPVSPTSSCGRRFRRTELLAAYQAADVLFLHLGAYAAFEKVLPSKLFEYAALGKPVLAGVAGYAAQFVREEIDNAAVFSPAMPHKASRRSSRWRW